MSFPVRMVRRPYILEESHAGKGTVVGRWKLSLAHGVVGSDTMGW